MNQINGIKIIANMISKGGLALVTQPKMQIKVQGI